MRNLIMLTIGASGLALAVPAVATTYTFSGGNYVTGTTAPEPLQGPDILELVTGSNKIWTAATLTNQSGTINWRAGNLYLGNGSQIANQSLMDVFGDNSILSNGGAASTFNNSGTFRKSGGAGTTTIGNVVFVNSGVIDAISGSILFNGGNATFNAGSQFTGAGNINIGNNATFNGGFSSANLNFNAGIFTGNAAVLNGMADWSAGTFAGMWNVAAGSTLTALSGSNKFLTAATLTNAGTIDWTDGNLYLGNGSSLTNNGSLNFSDTMSVLSNGGALSTLTNSATGTMQVDSGDTVTVSNRFVNNGGTITADGTFVFNGGNATFNDGTRFDGAGVNAINNNATFNGTIASSNVDFNSGTFTGGNAVLDGTADWSAGTFAGVWNVAAGSTLTALSGSNKFLTAATLTNDGTIDWTDGNLYLGNGSNLTNNGSLHFSDTMSVLNNGGTPSTLTNNATGTMQVDSGDTVTVSNRFVNNGGTITADGTFVFNGGNATFNDGTRFDGSGVNAISNNAAFNGTIASTNVDFNGGTFTGGNAVLNGAADWNAGTFAGVWNVAAASTLTVLTGTNKFMTGADFTNAGTIDWRNGNIYVGAGTDVTNDGTITMSGDNQVIGNGGTPSTLVNNGLIEKTGGAGVTTFNNGIGFDNQGTINVLSGEIQLPSNFANDGTLAGTGGFRVSGTLTNNGVMAPGDLGATGTLALTGNYLQTGTGSLATQLASTMMFDLLNVSGTASLSGALSLSCIMSCAINTGDSFVILNSVGALSGMFSSVTTSGFLNGFAYDVVYDYTNNLVRLDVLNAGAPPTGAVPEPATWAMLILGFGAVGGALRRSRRTLRGKVAL